MRGIRCMTDSPEASAEQVDLGVHPAARKRPYMPMEVFKDDER